MIDSVAGFHIDNEAPDLLVTVDSLHTRFVDYSVCASDSTKEFIVINTGTGTLKVDIASDDSGLFSIDKDNLSIAAGDSAKWKANFSSISDVDADKMNIYCLRDDGSWARFQSEGGAEKNRLAAYRGYFESDAPAEARMRAAAQPGTYKTMFQTSDQQGTGTSEIVNYDNVDYEGNIPFADSETTGIQPTILTIDADGTSRYFDLQGRLLKSKPDKGLFIENGKKAINR